MIDPRVILIAIMLGGLTIAGVGLKSYSHGRHTMQLEKDAEISKLRDDHQRAKDAQDARIEALNESFRLARQGADHDREKERAANAAALARVAADRNRLRDELAAAAAGGVEAADDSVAACRDRAATLGRVLGEALQAHAVCTGAAEENATGVRTLQRAWPVVSEQPVEVGSAHSLETEPSP